MAEHNELGKKGEERAAQYLEDNGYEVIERNFVFQKAEIDIIAKKDNILVIVEVKTRSSIDFGLPQDFVQPKKIQFLVKAANEYLISNDLDLAVRFDIVAVFKKNEHFEIEHIEDAFYHF